MKRRLGIFVGSSIILWGAAFGLAWILWPEKRQSTLICSSLALGQCLLPTLATLVWTSWGLRQTAEQQLTVILGATGLRMFFVLGVGLLLTQTVAYFNEHLMTFWLWVLVLYLSTLALEMLILVRGQETIGTTEDQSNETASKVT